MRFGTVRLAGASALLAALGAPVQAAPPADVAALHAAKRALAPAERKIESRLRALAALPPAARRHAHPAIQRAAGDPERVRVYVRVDGTPDLAALSARGLAVEAAPAGLGLVQGVARPRDLVRLADLPAVRSIRAPLRGRRRTGSVTSEGDAAARADLVRAAGFDGSGVVVGVISDGVEHRADAQASGDLDAVTVPAGPGCRAGSGDEGTAMLEIVHDLAPGATLRFSEGISSSLFFIESVGCLRAAGADVIVDDIGFFDEPFFADGPVAQAVAAAVAAGVSFHSAAGNDGEEHYEAAYRAASGSTLHDFRGGPTDTTEDLVVPAFGDLVCILQWSDPFGGSGNDYDLYLRDTSGALLDQSITSQTGTQDPFEFVVFSNPAGASRTVRLEIDRFSGQDRVLELFCFGADSLEYLTPTGAIFGHPGVAGVVAVAAIDALDPGLNDVEAFSSQGPTRILVPAEVTRAKPDLAAFDGVSVSNAGDFPSCPPFCLFFGTSAAAPHSAAVAALLLHKNPFLGPGTVQDLLRNTAVDVGPLGFDVRAGHGRLDALAAIAAVTAPLCFSTADCPDDGSACTTVGCPAGTCVVTPVACDDGDVCNGPETCNPTSGCVAGTPPACDDGDPCTTDACSTPGGCAATDLPGIAYLDCALESHLRPLLPAPTTPPLARLVKKLDRAALLVDRAAALPSRKARRKLEKARMVVRGIERLAAKPGTGLAPDAAAAIALEAQQIRFRIDDVRRFL